MTYSISNLISPATNPKETTLGKKIALSFDVLLAISLLVCGVLALKHCGGLLNHVGTVGGSLMIVGFGLIGILDRLVHKRTLQYKHSQYRKEIISAQLPTESLFKQSKERSMERILGKL